MKLHLLGMPHTITSPAFAHCAFTGKVARFARMMRPRGWEVIHYGNAGSESGANEEVEVLSAEEFTALLGHAHEDPARPFGRDATEDSPLYRQWNLDARRLLRERLAPGDAVLLPFGHAHKAAVHGLAESHGVAIIESGIGYLDCYAPWRIYESEAVRHAVMTVENRHIVRRVRPHIECVAPNYYDPRDWPVGPGGEAFVFAGRLVAGKGLAFILALAKVRPGYRFKIAGQGDITEWGPLPPNVEYVGVLRAEERAAYYGTARAILAPSLYVEPFCGVVVEAALCGTPAITSPFGAFTETVADGYTGIRPPSLDVQSWARALDVVEWLDRGIVAQRARALYSLDAVGRLYDLHLQSFGEALAAGRYPYSEFNP